MSPSRPHAPTYDPFPNGNVRLSVAHAPHSYRRRDDDEHRLEDPLGRAVLAIEDIVRVAVVEEQEALDRAQQEVLERRKRLRGERMNWYSKWLGDDLDQMLAAWQRARGIREFLAAYERQVPAGRHSTKLVAWVAFARQYADDLDPMSRTERICKDVAPSDEELELILADAKAEKSASPTR